MQKQFCRDTENTGGSANVEIHVNPSAGHSIPIIKSYFQQSGEVRSTLFDSLTGESQTQKTLDIVSEKTPRKMSTGHGIPRPGCRRAPPVVTFCQQRLLHT